MFHLLLGLTALGISLAALAVMVTPLWLGPLLQLAVTAFCKKPVYLLIPAAVGALVALLSAPRLWETVPPLYLAVYWCVYFLLLLAAYGVVRGIQGMAAKHRTEALEKKG